jgi:hypothetical protein
MAAPLAAFEHNQAAGMSKLVTVQGELSPLTAPSPREADERGRSLCAELEAGNILYFSNTPFPMSEDDLAFLLGRKQTSTALHKNIAYRPKEHRITGLDKSEGAEAGRLAELMRRYTQLAEKFLDTLLRPYSRRWKLDYGSYRPVQERGRAARLHARNDLPHFDGFPTRPTNGDRILRVFTNINPHENRVWLTTQVFGTIAPRFASVIGLPRQRNTDPVSKTLRALARTVHFPGANRSAYDDFMHRCHNAMKEDATFQENCPKQRWEFPPNSSWIAYTDCVGHAVLEGQFALEQTFIVSRKAMVQPEKSPVAILEKLAGYSLTNAD